MVECEQAQEVAKAEMDQELHTVQLSLADAQEARAQLGGKGYPIRRVSLTGISPLTWCVLGNGAG